MTNILFFDQNYLDPENTVAVSVSSEQTNFPASNLYNFQRRSKVWRSAGRWDITSSNNKIVFRETTGIDLTATIAVAAYTSTTTFLAAVKTALQAVGASIYTVTQDSTTLKIKITSSGAGGGGLFQLRCMDVNFTSAPTLGFSTGATLTGSLTYTADTLILSTGEWLKWDLGTASMPEAMVLLGPRNAPVRVSPTATVTLQGNTTDVWTSPQYSESFSYFENALAIIRQGGLYNSGLRYWRVTISDPSNTNGYVELGIAYLGELTSPDQGAVQFPLPIEYDDRSTSVTTEGGFLLKNPREKTQRFNLSLKGLTFSDAEAIQDIFERYGKSNPLPISMDPDAVFSSNSRKYLRYVSFESEPKFSLDSPNIFSATLQMLEEI